MGPACEGDTDAELQLEGAFLAVQRGTQGPGMSLPSPGLSVKPLGAAEGLPAPPSLPGKQVPQALEEQGGGTAGLGSCSW